MKNKPKYTSKIGEMITALGRKAADGRLVGDCMADYLAQYDGNNDETVICIRRAMKAYHKKYDKKPID